MPTPAQVRAGTNAAGVMKVRLPERVVRELVDVHQAGAADHVLDAAAAVDAA